MPKIYFFQLPKLNKYCLGVELALAQRVIEKLKMDHLWVHKLTECDKKQKGHASNWNSEYMYSIEK